MKTIISYVALAALIITSSFTIDTQQKLNDKSSVTGCFNFFRAHRQGSGVALSWSANTTGVTQFVVERSYDADFYDVINTVSCNGGASYKFNDTGIYPGKIYYRITAIKSDGTTESSPIEMVRIVQRNG